MIAEEPARLRVHTRRVFGGDGELTSINEVYCHRRRACVTVETCEACPEHAGSVVDLAHERNFVSCRELTTERARSVEPTRRTVLRRRFCASATSGEHTPLSEIMTADVFCVRADLSTAALAQLLVGRQLGGVPVVDEAGRAIGVVSSADLVRLPAAGQVAEIMTRLVFTLPDNASVSQAAALMALEHVHRIPVVADDDRVVGIVSSSDVLAWLARADGYVIGRR
jgi:CBS domain-containing protein